MARLYSTPTEAIVLRSLCSKDRAVSGYIFSQVDDTFLYNQEAVEAFNRIRTHIGKHGIAPAFKVLCEDVTLSEDAREFLKLADAQAKTIDQAEQIVANLDRYRKTRLLYKLAKAILQKLEGQRVDVESVVEAVSRRVAKLSLRRNQEESIFNIGRDSNVEELVKELLFGENNDQCIPTGFDTFDRVNGGFFRGSLVTIGGATGAGKCSLNSTRVSLPVYEVELEDNSILETGPEELVLVDRGNGVELLPAKGLVEHDELVLDPKRVAEWAHEVSVEGRALPALAAIYTSHLVDR